LQNLKKPFNKLIKGVVENNNKPILVASKCKIDAKKLTTDRERKFKGIGTTISYADKYDLI
jgi:hypothetical protein